MKNIFLADMRDKNCAIRTEKDSDDYKYGEKEPVRVAGQQDFDHF